MHKMFHKVGDRKTFVAQRGNNEHKMAIHIKDLANDRHFYFHDITEKSREPLQVGEVVVMECVSCYRTGYSVWGSSYWRRVKEK